MPFTKRNGIINIPFDDQSASYMKALLIAEIASHSDPAEKAMIQDLYDSLQSCVKTAFGPAIWAGL